MRFSHILSAALAAAPLAVSARGTLGFALGGNNPDGSCKSSSDYETDFAALKSYTTLVRTYTSSQCNTSQNIIPAAKSAGFQVLLGIWVANDGDVSYNNDVAALQASVPGNEDAVYGITVGSEVLYRKDLTADQLLPKIQAVQILFPKTLVGTADSWNKYADGTADPLIKGGVKLLLCNGFSYWQGQEIKNATASYFDDMMQAIGHIQSVSGSIDAIKIMNGETGWPTDGGTDFGAAKAGTNNAKTYWKSGICGMLDWGVDLFYFEAFDEPQKPDAVGENGQSSSEKVWGAFNVDRTPKFDLSC